MNKFSIVGKALPMIDAWEKVTGKAKYTDDLNLPMTLCGKILRSPYPHAKILNIDISKAKKLKGVKAIITGKDIPNKKYGIVPKAQDEYALAIDKVRYIGDEVAAVAAVDEDTAEEAIELIRVDYEILPPVFNPEESMKDTAPRIHEGLKNNISATIWKEFGNIDEGFKNSDYVREDKFYSQAVGHAPMEPHTAMAYYESSSGKITIWSSTQIPYFLRRNLSTTLNIPENKIRVIKPKVGGGFGGKVDMFTKDFAVCYLSMKTGQPVKITYTREESLTCTRQRHPMIIYVKTGVKKDGTVIAQHYRIIADGGAYNSTAPLIILLSAFFAMIPYKIQNLVFEGYHVYTNKPVGGAMRGHGIPQIRFASETQLDIIAEEIGIDPLDIRLKNAIKAGEPHPAKMTIRSCGFSDSLIKAAESIRWKEKRGRQKDISRGVGLGCSAFPSGVSNMMHIGSAAIVKIGRDGSVTLLTGASDIGQGSDSVLAQICAEELGVNYEDIRVTSADTELTPLDPGTFGSGVTFRAGNAVKEAAKAAKRKIFEVVSEKLEANIDDLETRNGRIYIKGSPEKGVSFVEALKLVQYADKPMPVIGRGFYQPPAKEPTTLLKEDGDISAAYSFSSQAAEVEVDRETGVVKVLNFVTSHDSGRSINPMALEGQLEGSVICGMGQAITEEFIREDGATLNPTFLNYKLPTAMEIPNIDSIHIVSNDPLGPYGAKEAGEGTQVATIPAITNAISDATGIRIKELPVNPETILKGLNRKED
jgi:4-hydroxybenzoyl-CoA reductase subunit alpha